MDTNNVISVKRCNILGVGVHAVNTQLALECIEAAVAMQKKGYICATPVHSIMVAQDDCLYKDVLNGAFLCVPDGVPLVWVGRSSGYVNMKRVYGPDLMRAVLNISPEKSWSHYLYGSTPETLDQLEESILKDFPGIKIAGRYSPPFRDLTTDEFNRLQADVATCRPDIFWVGLGAPKQDFFMAENLELLDTTIMIGVGAAFDFLSGNIAESPGWMQKSGLQWLHRLYKEPRRLWRRYLVNNPRFVFMLLLQKLGIRKFPLGKPE